MSRDTNIYEFKEHELLRIIPKKRGIPETKFIELYTSDEIINEISKNLKIERNEIFRKKRGNLHRQLALYLIKRYTPISLREIGKLFSMDYAAVSQSVKRLEGKTQRDKRASMIKETAIGRLKKS